MMIQMVNINHALDWIGEPISDSIKWRYDAYALDEQDPVFQSLSRLHVSLEEAIAARYLQYLYDEVHVKGFTLFQSWSGRHRSGKSLTSCAEGYILDPTFYPRMEKRIIRDHNDLFDEVEWIMKTKTKGAYLSIDEGGVSMASSDWQEKWAQDLAKALQMIGWLLPMFSIAAPSRDFVQSKVRKLIHLHNTVRRSSISSTVIHPYHLLSSDITGKQFHPHPRINLCGQTYVLNSVRITKPPQFLIGAYERIANPAKEEQMKEFVSRAKEKNIKYSPLDLDVAAHIVAANPETFMSFSSQRKRIVLSPELIRSYEGFDKQTDGGVSSYQAKIIKEKAMRILKESGNIKKETTD